MAGASTSWRARWALGALVAGYALVTIVASAQGSPLVPPLPAGAEPASWLARIAHGFGLDRMSRLGLTIVSLSLLAVLVTAFVAVVAEALRGRVAVRAVAVAGVAALAIAVAAPLLLSRDVYSYAAYGREYALHGANPYVTPPSAFPADPLFRVVSPEWRGTRSVYGPAFTLISAALAKLWSGSPGATVLAFKVLAGLAMAGAAGLAAGAAGRWGRPERRALAVALVALNPVIVVHTVGGGHNDALVGLGLAAAAWLAAPPPAARGRAPAVTAVLAVASLVKIVAAIPLALWIWSEVRTAPPGSRLRTLGQHAGVAAVVAAVLTAPLFAGWRSVTAVANLASRQGWASGARLVARGVEAVTGAGVARLVYVAFLAAFALAVWALERRATDPHPARWGRALVLFALFAPYLLPWYVAWFVPVLALIDDRRLVWIGVALGSLLALTGVPAEPDGAASLWRGMLLGVHYVAAPAALALLALGLQAALEPPASGARSEPRRLGR
jgi:alpha-1,6-mannosyltransferase